MNKNLLALVIFLFFGFLSFISVSQIPVQVQVFYGGYGEECSWNITNSSSGSVVISGIAGASNSFSYNSVINLPAGNYTFNAFDSYGDGWSNGDGITGTEDGWYRIIPTYGISIDTTYFLDGSSQSGNFSVYVNSPSDLGLNSWISPVSGPSLSSSQNITIQIKNFGTVAANSYTVSYSINNGNSFVTETINTTLLPGNTSNYTFSQTANLSTPGTYHCKAAVHLNNDINVVNDSISIDINSIQTISTFPWSVTFGSWPVNGWSLSGGNQNWALYNSGSISCAYCNFYFWPSGNAVLTSPPVNLTSPSTFKFSWSKGFNQNYLNDEFQVMISTDNMQTWNTIWDKTGVSLNSNDGATSSAPGTFIQETIDFSQFTGSIIYIRFNGISGYGYNLFLDNVIIEQNAPTDLAAIEWNLPATTSCGLTSSEAVTVKIQNIGSQPISNFILAYSINNGQTFTSQVLNTTVSAGSYYTHTFSTFANFSNFGNYNCKFFVHAIGDLNTANDTLSGILVKNLNVINSFPFTENFQTASTAYFNIYANENASTSIVNESGNYCLKMEGGTSTGWVGTSTGTTAENAWTNNTTHQSFAITCSIDATLLPTCEVLLNLKQYYRTGSKYTWFRVLVNNQQVADQNGVSNFNPTTSQSDPYVTHTFNLNAYAGTQFVLTLEASNKYNSSSYYPGNVSFIDNIIVRQVPGTDVGINSLVSPSSSSCALTINQPITIQLKNNSSSSIGNFNVSYSINGGNTFVSQLVTSSISSGGTLNFTFTQNANMLTTGSYPVIVAVSLNGDSNPANDSLFVTINNNELPTVSFSGLAPSYCYYNSAALLTGNPGGGIFSGQGISGNNFNPSIGAGTYSITYNYTNSLTGCTNQTTQSVSVYGSQVSISGLSNSYCINSNPVNLTGQPSGGVFSGQGVSGNIFNPSIAGTGTYAVTYTYETNGCTSNSSQNVMINPVPAISLSSPAMVCSGLATTINAGSGYSSYLWNNNATTSSISVDVSGTYSVTVSNVYSCTNSAQTTASFYPVPSVDLGPNQSICYGSYQTLSAGNFSSYLWSNASTTSSIQVTLPGIYSVTVVNSYNCTGSDNIMISNNPVPDVNLGNDQTIYNNQTTTLNAGSGFSSYLWSTGSPAQTILVDGSSTGIGTFDYSVTVVNSYNCSDNDNVTITVLPTVTNQYIDIPSGWSMFSTNVNLVNPSLNNLFASVVSSLVIVKDGSGNVYWPAYSVNLIGNIILGNGYQARMLSNQTIIATGYPVVPETTPINVPQGWFLLGYLRQAAAPVTVMTSSLLGNLYIVKDEHGYVYWPAYGFNNIGDMIPGKAYQIYLTAPATFYYPANSQNFEKEQICFVENNFYKTKLNTGNNMTLCIPIDSWDNVPSVGDEIGIFDAHGSLEGSAVFTGKNSVITIWGNDFLEPKDNCITEGEEFFLKLWEHNSGIEKDINVISYKQGDNLFAIDKISVVEKLNTTNNFIDNELYISNYLNIVNGNSLLEVFVSEKSQIEITFYNTVGIRVKNLSKIQFNKGFNKVEVLVNDLATGHYVCTVNNGHASDSKIITVINK